MESKLIAANWKENPGNELGAIKLFRSIVKEKISDKVKVVICPPFLYLERFAEVLKGRKHKNLELGAQDAFWEEKGPYTSEVGPKMLKSIGVNYVIIGHSERRKWLKETDAVINKKIKLALQDGLHVILCVGESLSVRNRGVSAAQNFVKSQLKKDLAGLKKAKITVAYEPIWAIGSGKYDEPEDAAGMTQFIKDTVKAMHLGPNTGVLYGGSVNSKNIGDYIQYKSIDGALVGGASLKAGGFKKILKITSQK